jgi:predicted metalloprotease with PDZ domain
VRAAHLDQTHGFFNGTSVFLRVVGQEEGAHEVDIQRPGDAAAKTWRVATAMKELGAKRYGFGTYVAANYDELIDHPVEMGDFALSDLQGARHPARHRHHRPRAEPGHGAPAGRPEGDLRSADRPVRAGTKKAPIDRYVFMTMAVGDGYGGLEHRASTALICARADLPSTAQARRRASRTRAT